MRIQQWLTALFLLFHLSANAGEIILSGLYQGKNLFVQNPFAANRKDFCTDEVYVNDVQKMTNIRSSAYEIDLSFLKMYDSVTVRIVYKEDCMPKVLNSYVLRPSETFQFVSFDLKGDSLQWTVSGDKKQNVYFVEQLNNYNWLVIKTVKAENAIGGIYSIGIPNRSQQGKYRIRMQDPNTHKLYLTEIVEFTPSPVAKSSQTPITFYPKSVTTKITLSREAIYEVRATDGKVIKKGKGKEIPLADLSTGVYYLSINNKTEKFFKK